MELYDIWIRKAVVVPGKEDSIAYRRVRCVHCSSSG